MLTMGLDLDEKGGPTAIAVVERGERKDERGKETDYHDIWFMERLSGRPDHEAMERMAEIVDEATHRNGEKGPTLYVNVTDPGSPGLGMLRFNQVRPRMTPVYLTEGDEWTEADGQVKLGKDRLVSRLQKLLKDARLRALEEARAGAVELKQELMDYRIGDEPGPLMVALGLAVHKERNRVGRIITWGGPGSPNPYRNLSAEQGIRDWLHSLH